jgi:hypothetical protein
MTAVTDTYDFLGAIAQQKWAFIQEILFSFCKWGTSAQKKGHALFHF